MKKQALSKKSEELIDELASSAMSHGWAQDSGTGSSVDSAECAYNDALGALRKHVLRLERRVIAERAKVKVAVVHVPVRVSDDYNP